MWGLPQKQNARRAYKIRLCGHLRRYKKIVKKTYIILLNFPDLLQLIVTVLVIVWRYTSFLYCLKDAVALADAPDMYAFFSESFQLLAGQVVEISDLIHLDDEVSAESSIKIDLT